MSEQKKEPNGHYQVTIDGGHVVVRFPFYTDPADYDDVMEILRISMRAAERRKNALTKPPEPAPTETK